MAPVLIPAIQSQLLGTYYEPFLGGGAVFLRLQPLKARLSDINEELIECLKAVRDSPGEVLTYLRTLKNLPSHYQLIRDHVPQNRYSAAARLIFLNKTCWGGIYRLNRKGEFNVPFGNSGRPFYREEDIIRVSKVLRSAALTSEDFEEAIDRSGKGDVVYADPPYTAKGSNNGFIRYNDKLFAWKDQERLAKCAKRASRRGSLVFISSSLNKEVLELYPDWHHFSVHRSSLVSRDPSARGVVHEALIVNRLP